MKLIVNERNECCESVHIEYTPTEALVINQAMRRYVNDEEMNEADRAIMKKMLEVEPIFVDVEENDKKGLERLEKLKAEIPSMARFESADGQDLVMAVDILQAIDQIINSEEREVKK